MNIRYTLNEKIKMQKSQNRLRHYVTRPLYLGFAMASVLAVVATNTAMLHVRNTSNVSDAVSIISPSAQAYTPAMTTVVAKLAQTPATDYTMFWYVDNGAWNWMGDSSTISGAKQADIDLSGWKWHAPSDEYAISVVAVMNDSGQRIYSSIPVHASAAPQSTAATNATNNAAASTTAQAANQTATTSVQTQASATTVKTNGNSNNTTSSLGLYVNPSSGAAATAASTSDPVTKRVMTRLAGTPTSTWFGNWNSNVQSDVNAIVAAAANVNQIPVLVAYNIPGRDCGSYSAGGAGDSAAYLNWVNSFGAGIGNRPAIVILEPDALAQMDCLSSTAQAARYQMLSNAITSLKTHSGTRVYVDGGNATWIAAAEMSNRLKTAGISAADGFSLNVSNFITTADSTAYGKKVSAATGNKHFVIDTSRNGNGASSEWCNPSGRALGVTPTNKTGDALTDYFLWIKVPGESDGTCNGGPSAGTWWPSYAQDLALRAGW